MVTDYILIFVFFPSRLDEESNLIAQTSREEDNKNVQEEALVFIVDRVRGAPNGDGSLRFAGYHQRTGKVNMCIFMNF